MCATKTSRNVAPLQPVVRLFIAEDIRQELNGKVSAMGLYPDNVVVLKVPNGEPEPTEETPRLVKSLGFMFSISKIPRACKVTIEMESNGVRKKFMEPRKVKFPGVGKSITVVGALQPFPVDHFGVRKFVVTVGDFVTELEFEFRRDHSFIEAKIVEEDEDVAIAKKLVVSTKKAKSEKTIVKRPRA